MLSSPPDRILVVCLRRLGDVLLATPLIRSLRRAYPEARIDALVFAATTAALEGNPDLDRVIAWPAHAGVLDSLRIAGSLFRAYDLACVVTASDRAQWLAALAAPRRSVTVQAEFPRGWLNPVRVVYEPARLHTVRQSLALLKPLGLAPVPELVPPRAAGTAGIDALLGPGWAAQKFAVVHPAPMFRYKAWTLEGWQALIDALRARGLRVVLSGGPAAAEQAFVERLRQSLQRPDEAVISVAGQLSLAELSRVLARAAVFIGPDTSVTHLAAACGAPTVALFGPSSPLTWGPWPQGWSGAGDSPWRLTAPAQRIGGVTILQGTQGRYGNCIPCLQEGCERHLGSGSDCLDTLPAQRVIDAVDQLLAGADCAPA
ncbi:MAG: glycosyltransferase family 9 protein [Nevskia sp.]